jgi:uncharacterized membrane protein
LEKSLDDIFKLLAEIIGLYFIAPAVLSLFFHIIMKRLGWVKDGDMKLQG